LDKKLISPEEMQIVRIGSKLSKTVGVIAVLLDLAELRLKNLNKMCFFFY